MDGIPTFALFTEHMTGEHYTVPHTLVYFINRKERSGKRRLRAIIGGNPENWVDVNDDGVIFLSGITSLSPNEAP